MPPPATSADNPLQRPLFLGFDVGGTNIKLGLVDDAGKAVAKTSVPTHEEQGPREAVRRARIAVDEMLGGIGLKVANLAAVGLAVPGTMDIPRGRVTVSKIVQTGS